MIKCLHLNDHYPANLPVYEANIVCCPGTWCPWCLIYMPVVTEVPVVLRVSVVSIVSLVHVHELGVPGVLCA